MNLLIIGIGAVFSICAAINHFIKYSRTKSVYRLIPLISNVLFTAAFIGFMLASRGALSFKSLKWVIVLFFIACVVEFGAFIYFHRPNIVKISLTIMLFIAIALCAFAGIEYLLNS